MIYATVCFGIEAPSLAWHPLGWEAAFFSEIEKFPSRLLAHPIAPATKPLATEIFPAWKRISRLAYADGAMERTECLWLNPACAAALQQKQGSLFAINGE